MEGKGTVIGGMALGVWLLAAPFTVYGAMLAPNFWNDVLIGVAVVALALYGLRCVRRGRTMSIATGGLFGLLGLWQVTRPFVVATAGPFPKWGDAVVGVLLAFLGGRMVREARTAALEQHAPSDVGGD
jgi:purine-cytosine permease-like protein